MRVFLAFAACCVRRLTLVPVLLSLVIVACVLLRKRHIDQLKVAFVRLMVVDGIGAFLLQSLVLPLLLDNVLVLF